MAETPSSSLVVKKLMSTDVQQSDHQSASESVDYNTLPDVPIRTIFSAVPLPELITTIPLVHPRWSAVQPDVLAAKRHLVLYIGEIGSYLIPAPHIPFADQVVTPDGQPLLPDSNFDNELNRLEFASLTDEIVDKLTTQMPLISALQLTIDQVDPEELTQVMRLLEYWGPSLKTLKLHCRLCSLDQYQPEMRAEAVQATQPLIAYLNKLPLLEHLELHCLDFTIANEPFDLPIMGQLKHLQLYTDTRSMVLFKESLMKYAEPNEQLQTISLEPSVTRSEVLADFGTTTNLKHRFIKFNYMLEHDPDDQIHARFCRTFTKLRTYKIFMCGLDTPTLTQLQLLLAPMENLYHIRIVIGDTPIFRQAPPASISSLPSVKVLALSLNTVKHTELAYPHWGKLFPAVEILKVDHDYRRNLPCTLCPDCYDAANKNAIIKKDCVKKLLMPFKQCGALKKIYYQQGNIVYPTHEFVFAIDEL